MTAKKVLRILILVILVAVLTACAVYFVIDYLHYKSITEIGGVVNSSVISDDNAVTQPKPTIKIPIDFDELKAVNKDIYAWITIPDTNIDYPILQSLDED